MVARVSSEPTAEDVLRAYVRGWLAGDPDAVVATVSEDVVITESHGPTYLGDDEVRAWIEGWVARGDHVHRWDLLTVIESADGSRVAAEWDLACTAAGVDYQILGATVTTVHRSRLTRVMEYRREPEDP
ncbi:MAG: nuclear transport factor 2 family protein [Demequina sp.]